jgi:ABC-2 type transport system ATP-binding protein
LAEVRGDVTGFRLDCDDPGAALRVLAELGVAEALPCEGPSGVVVSGRLGAVAPEKVVAGLVHAGIGVAEFRQSRPSLEDTFVSITGEGFDVSG